MNVWFGIALGLAAMLAARPALALSVQEAILLAKPAVALVTARVDAEITMNCGQGLVTVKPKPFIETGTGWFVDGRGWLITNAHVVDPAHRLPRWVIHELKKKAIDEACVEPALKARGLIRGEKPELEDQIRRTASARALDSAQVEPQPQLSVLLSNGMSLPAEVKKFSPPALLDVKGKPLPDSSGRDLALLRVKDGVYPALVLSGRDAHIGDPVHILGFPGVVLMHELLSPSATVEASVTNGAVSSFQVDAIGQDIIQTDAPAAHGTSGGPAIGDDSRLLGVLTFVSLSPSGAQLQGYNFLIPARDVRTFLQGTEARPGESRFNPVWAAGVEALLAERYSTAAARLKEANQLLPNLTDVKKALGEAEFKLKHPPPRPFPWAWATVGVSLLSAGAYGGMFARRWWRNRFRIVPAQVIAAIESGDVPVLLDVRSQTDYETSPLRLPGAVRLEPEAVTAPDFKLDIEPKRMIVAYCTSPEEATSAAVAQKLRERGFKRMRILKGGLGGWTNARLPVESKSALPSIGLEIYKNLTLGDLERRRFQPGEVITKEGADAHGEAYVIHSGVVEVRRMFDGEHRLLRTMSEGELIGELALFREAARSTDIIAQTDVELLVIKNERLDWLIRNRPQLAIEIVRRLANLVVQTDRERALANR